MRRVIYRFTLLMVATSRISGQSALSFEVTSVRPSSPGSHAGPKLDAAHFSCSGETIRTLIFSAYQVPAWTLSGGPASLDTDPWDITATLPPNMPAAREELTRQADLMLQSLLADRFKLEIHRETREQPVYELVVARSGSKLKPSPADKFSVKIGAGHLDFHHLSMAVFVSYLFRRSPYCQQVADRPVLDMTRLQGSYDLTMDWTPYTIRADVAAGAPPLSRRLKSRRDSNSSPANLPLNFS
jgi:uncharacterized protein (TIGR03435 family)